MIRKAKISDSQKIESLMKSVKGFWDDSWRKKVIRQGIISSDGLSFVYEENDNILGFVCAHDLGFRAYLSELIVSEKMQKKGIGKKLLERVEKELKERECHIIVADVWKDAKIFYVNSGWSTPEVILLRKKM